MLAYEMLSLSRLSPSRHGRVYSTPPEHIAEGTTISTLSISRTQKSDAGMYTCVPAMMDDASVLLHVIDSK